MKFYYLFSILLVVLYTTIAKKINKRNSIVNSKTKKNETSDECKYINSLIGKDESFNCCGYSYYSCDYGLDCDIDLGFCEMSHSIEDCLNYITCENGHIIDIYLYSNDFNVPIPESLGNLSELKYLDLSDNKLIGSIPDSIGKLKKLEYLNLQWNKLSGPIPESIGNLTNLKGLYLSRNNLSGHIPESIGKLINLESLFLVHNNLNGHIPESIENLTKLTRLLISYNNLCGTITEFVKNIKYTWFNNNYFDFLITDTVNPCNGKSNCTKEELCNITRCGTINYNEPYYGIWERSYGECPNGECCSKKGFCGTTVGFCSPSLGCQKKYGKCIETRCGKGIGKCPSGQCCSKKGYCGTSSAFCSSSKGCQSKYGKCTPKKVVTVVNKTVIKVTKKMKN